MAEVNHHVVVFGSDKVLSLEELVEMIKSLRGGESLVVGFENEQQVDNVRLSIKLIDVA